MRCVLDLLTKMGFVSIVDRARRQHTQLTLGVFIVVVVIIALLVTNCCVFRFSWGRVCVCLCVIGLVIV